ncbi:transcription-repair coupling factor [Campylobacter porcelli]|uniref:Transcription-repair-coupling factor n=1 Tax=Campylobacter porcelli TaxID=1660073 RepID=A0ABU7M549_9BACT|nr:transcription-repair coupling factor [Campylobacter sp. CX2-4855-23]
MQSRVYEFFKTHKDQFQILIVGDDKDTLKAYAAASYAGRECFILPDFRAKNGDDLRAFNSELLDISKALSEFHLSTNPNKLIISPFRTILNKLPNANQLKVKKINFADTIDLNSFKDEMLGYGYTFVDIVESRGEIRVSGDIIDIFSVGDEQPCRITLDIDIVESIRRFDPATQKSISNEESITITPYVAALSDSEFKSTLDSLQDIKSNNLVNDLNSFGFWVIDGFIDYLEQFKAIKDCEIDYDDCDMDISKLSSIDTLPKSKIYRAFEGSINSDLIAFHKDKKIEILSSNESAFRALGLEINPNLSFIKSDLILNLISKDELIISLNRLTSRKKRQKTSIVLDELKIGDFVVHSEYGIGKFAGLELICVLGNSKEFVVLTYQNDDRLLLPTEHLDMIDRYIAGSGAVVNLDKLGKASFTKLKQKVKEKLFIIASKIISLAAKRELIEGVKIDIDSAEFASFQAQAGFEYTQDQSVAINSILNHLRSGKVMDMLLSGDVGFGKTEVAMNAIFACVKSGFQALFFVPTTLLCAQHYKSLSDRLSKFDIDVRRLDRFSTAKDKARLLADLKGSKPLVVIGTHALLSVQSANLGLIIIDEEHKFGVKQKEKLKEFSDRSHLLSMSATPIPRSLNMALSSIKSYATLTTPPLDRLDVRTFVKQWDRSLIKEAIMRELRRAGQIFYLHNKIADMPSIEREIKDIVPNLKILTLHSKIDAKTSEDEMIKFANGEYDLLLCTSIVESGIHIPNANTIIIDEANKFGIADLHQLRGRVGRGSKQGYCYFLVENKDELSDEALKRLVALESNSFLGSGALLAYHDLEIRGGGNLIGEAQSGHIEAIGYSLYLKMLEDEINSLLNKNDKKESQVDIKLSVNAFLNSELISEDRLRLELYRRLSKCNQASEVYEIGGEIEDRFGKLDIYTKQFLDIIVIKIMSAQQGFKSVSSYEQNITLTKIDGTKVALKSPSKDDDDVLAEILRYLRKNR